MWFCFITHSVLSVLLSKRKIDFKHSTASRVDVGATDLLGCETSSYRHIAVRNEIRVLTLWKTWPTCWPGSKHIRVKLVKIHAFFQVSKIYRVIFLTLAWSATSARRRTFCSCVTWLKCMTGISRRGWLTACKTAGHCRVVSICKLVAVLQSGHIHARNKVHLSREKNHNQS